MAVLELLAEHPGERFTLSEVARRCRLNKATAHALLSALSERGVLLRHPEEKRYSLGPRLVAIGEAARRGYTAADFAPPVLDRLATTTGLWARAWRDGNDAVVCVAEAGPPADFYTGGVRPVPLVPPVGAVFMAWRDPATVEAWLARAASAESVPGVLEALEAVRRAGTAITLPAREWRDLCEGRLAAAPLDDPGVRRSLHLAISRGSLLVPAPDEGRTYPTPEVAAPVFDAAGEVVLALTVTPRAAEAVPGNRLRMLAARVAAAAGELTAAVRGRRP